MLLFLPTHKMKQVSKQMTVTIEQIVRDTFDTIILKDPFSEWSELY